MRHPILRVIQSALYFTERPTQSNTTSASLWRRVTVWQQPVAQSFAC